MSDNKFNLQINFTKAYEDEPNVAYIEGVASGPEVDLLNERMSPKALQSMVKSLHKGIIEFRDVHGEEWNAELGEVVELSLTDDNHLFYKAKLDLNISAARDLIYRITKQGKKLGVSVGGSIKKAGYEYAPELGKSIYTYFDVGLTHIGITRQAVYHQSFARVVAKSLSAVPMDFQKSGVTSDQIYDILSENYPAKVLGWVRKADWSQKNAVPLDSIDMARRPGGRDPEKVKGIAEAIEAGKLMDPVVLVDYGTDKLQIADGYHRTLAYQHLNKSSITAYIGSGLEPGGPWEKAMHDEKLNKSLTENDEIENTEEVIETETQASAVAAEEQSDATQTEVQEAKTEEEAEEAAVEESDANSEEAKETAEEETETTEESAGDAESEEAEAEPDHEVTKALTAAQGEVATLQKSLTDTLGQVTELTKSLEAKTNELESISKSLEDTKASLAEKETELEKRETRKAVVFSKFEGVAIAKSQTTPEAKSSTLSRWMNS